MTASARGPFITIEGVDGAGKSSHIPAIVAQLQAAGFTVVASREPGGTELGEWLREKILRTPKALPTDVLLAFASRAEHLVQVIRPGLEAGSAVVSDRFTDSTFAFQGAGQGFPRPHLEALEEMVHGDLQPDLTLLFDLPIEQAGQRLNLTGKDPDRFESQAAAFHERVREAYHERVRSDRGRFVVIDSSPSFEEVARQVRDAVAAFVTRWTARPLKKNRP